MTYDFHFLGMERNKFGKVSRESSGCYRLAHSDEYKSELPELVTWRTFDQVNVCGCSLKLCLGAVSSGPDIICCCLYIQRHTVSFSRLWTWNWDLLYEELGIGQKESAECSTAFYCGHLTLNIPSLARQRCLPSWGPRRTPWFFFCNFSTAWCGRLLKLCFGGFWNYNSVIQALLASNILCLFISTEVTGGTERLHTLSSLIQHLNNVIFWALSAGHFSILQRSEPKNNKNNNIPHL